jgi:hypothetical protein
MRSRRISASPLRRGVDPNPPRQIGVSPEVIAVRDQALPYFGHVVLQFQAQAAPAHERPPDDDLLPQSL